jgi:hypothetical protein
VAPRRFGAEDLKQMPLERFFEIIDAEARWPRIDT